MDENKYLHYQALTPRGEAIDPYVVLEAYAVTHPCQQHAIKKLLRVHRTGESGKSTVQEIEEVMFTLKRWLEMLGDEHVRMPVTVTCPVCHKRVADGAHSCQIERDAFNSNMSECNICNMTGGRHATWCKRHDPRGTPDPDPDDMK